MHERLAEIRTELERFWAEQDPMPAGNPETVDALVAAMDSMTACEVLERLERLLDIELPSGDLIRRGGYDSKDQFVNELSQAVADYGAENAT